MEIPLHAQVRCSDGPFGRSVYLLLNPLTDKATHLVVQEATQPKVEYLVPINLLADAHKSLLRLNCCRAALERMEPFLETKFIGKEPDDIEMYGFGSANFLYWPYITPEFILLQPAEIPNIPAGETTIHAGTRVEATDGLAGRLEECIIDTRQHQVTHLILRHGPFWAPQDLVLPITLVADIHADSVYLNINKLQVYTYPLLANRTGD